MTHYKIIGCDITLKKKVALSIYEVIVLAGKKSLNDSTLLLLIKWLGKIIVNYSDYLLVLLIAIYCVDKTKLRRNMYIRFY